MDQGHAAGFGETGLAAAAFAVEKLEQLITQYFFAKELREAGDGLFDRADAAHHFGALLEELPQLFFCLADHFLDVSVSRRLILRLIVLHRLIAGDDLHCGCALLDLHKSSVTATLRDTGSLIDTQKGAQVFPDFHVRATEIDQYERTLPG
jgi:hypothetical protein